MKPAFKRSRTQTAMLSPSTALTVANGTESAMASILVRRPLLMLPVIALLAMAGIEIAPAAGHLAAIWLDGMRFIFAGPVVDGGPGLGAILFVSVILFLAGVVSGLAGFAFSAVAACVLWLLPPLQAVPLIMLLSTCNQLLSIGKLRREITLLSTPEREGALPYIIGGLFGVPLGVALLRSLPTDYFAAGLGFFLIIYSAFTLLMPSYQRIAISGWKAAAAVGVLGGIVGGFSGFGASILVVYLGLRGVDKSTTRGITQPFIVAMQLVSLITIAIFAPAVFNAFFWLLWAMTLPAVLLGTSAGVALYRRLSDHNFRRAVLVLLILSGASLVAKAVI
jgi:uncharacterized protein